MTPQNRDPHTANYRSLVAGGFFSSDPFDKRVPASIRCNNPGAINGASWEKTYPGYVSTVETTPGNKTTIFEAPEYGVAAWWDLLRRYALAGHTTVRQIITEYERGQDSSEYLAFVVKQTGFDEGTKVRLDDDGMLMAFGKAMFRFEAGRKTPLKDEQIQYGTQFGRLHAGGGRLLAPVRLATAETASPNFYENVIKKDPRFKSTNVVSDLNLLEPVTRMAVEGILTDAQAKGINLMVFETYRSQARQTALYEQGATQLKTVGVHHFGLACDIVKSINGTPSWKGDFSFLRKLAKGRGLIWGGDWGAPDKPHNFQDDDHVQRVTIARQKKLFAGTWYPDASYDPYKDGAS